MDGIHKSIFLWGLISLIGFAVYHLFLGDPSFPQPMILWSVLSVIGIAGMILWVPNWMKNKAVHVWAVVVVLGMVYHWAFMLKMLPAIISNVWAYWALLMAIGFVGTAHFWKDKFWYYVGALNFLFFLVSFFAGNMLGAYQSLVLGLVSGLPTMYHGWTGK